MDFNQNLFILTEQFNNQKRQLKIAGEADRIARKRYHTNVETFMVGQISTLDLNDARSARTKPARNTSTSCSITGTTTISCAASRSGISTGTPGSMQTSRRSSAENRQNRCSPTDGPFRSDRLRYPYICS